MVAGGLVGRLAELPHELLEDGAHLDVADHVGVQVDLGELLDHQVEAVGLVKLLDLGLEAEVLDDLAGTLAEAGDVVLQVGGDVGGVVGELGKVEAAGVVKRLPGDVVEHRLDVGKLTALEALMPREHRGLGRLEHAVEAAEHSERQDHAAVLGGLVGAAQQVRDTPDEADLVAEAVHQRCPFRRALLPSSPSERVRHHSIGTGDGRVAAQVAAPGRAVAGPASCTGRRRRREAVAPSADVVRLASQTPAATASLTLNCNLSLCGRSGGPGLYRRASAGPHPEGVRRPIRCGLSSSATWKATSSDCIALSLGSQSVE